jgi:replicative DNA helicase
MLLKPEILPHDTVAETSVVACLIRDTKAIAEVGDMLREDDFYSSPARVAFGAVVEMNRKGIPIDIVQIADFIHKAGKIEDCKYDFLVDLHDNYGSTANLMHYAKIVVEHSKRRRVIEGCREIARQSFDLTDPIEGIITKGGDLFFATLTMGQAKTAVHQSDVVRRFYELMDRQNKGSESGEVDQPYIPSGWSTLDDCITGFFNSEFSVVAARPSIGKTVFAGCLIHRVASRGHHVLFCSIEQKDTAIIQRMFSSKTRIPGYKIFRGQLDHSDIQLVLDHGPSMESLPIWWVDSPSQTISQISSVSKRLKLKGRLDMVVVDYLQIIKPDSSKSDGTRTEEVAKISWGLKQLARELEIPVIALAQLNRGVTNRTDPTPKLSDIRECGNIEQDADTVLLLHKTEEPDLSRRIDQLHVIVAKQRNGELGVVPLLHHKEYFDITDASGSHGSGGGF